MRAATLAALIVAGILAIPVASVLSPVPPVATIARPDDGVGTVAGVVNLPTVAPRVGRPAAPATPVARRPAPPAALTAALTARDSPPPSAAPLLELVTIARAPGSPPAAPRPISPTEAVDSVMRSPEFQDTVSPLARLYFAAFGRFPDYDGLNHYTGVREGGTTLAEIANEFARGREFEIRYGPLDNAEFVARILANVLGNASQADVRAYWAGELDAGRMTRGQVIADLAESGMFRERTANQVFVSTAYAEILRRTPDGDGYRHWVSILDAGYPATTVIDGLLASR